ncbi:MAG: bifunctional phosphopantothenoylcysteine decarboxylase/phosphopantothenate--cysteine ligase CoaBC [Rhodospirillales bacterium]|nr:bifunctional phosphopantothenoylcysteine decarboxylase/phosphopantothenate--cysteine ligase CoaBC [Rhodospirillales bacterium]
MQEAGNGSEADAAALRGKRILLVIAGGIAAYKCLDLIRRLRENGAMVRCVLTRAGAAFVTPLSVETLAGQAPYTDTLALTGDSEIAHIRLGQEADIVVVAPATADIMAKMAHGIADDLATSTLIAADKPTLLAPAMNTRMWQHPATERNRTRLEADGVAFVGPNDGPLAEGESGPGRMAEVPEIAAAIADVLGARSGPLAGLRVLVTSGPTYEPIDPVRFLGNRSSGKQGHAIAAACAEAGADVLLVSGPTAEAAPEGVETVGIETAEEMLTACEQGLPVDIAICAAAVSDWRAAVPQDRKIKKGQGEDPPTLTLAENPDILASLSATGPKRPRLVIGFAAETEDVEANATAKLATKGCDWILANQVAEGAVFGDDENVVHLLTRTEDGGAPAVEEWPRMSKAEVAARLVRRIADALSAGSRTA